MGLLVGSAQGAAISTTHGAAIRMQAFENIS
jgi:hypothetical protein